MLKPINSNIHLTIDSLVNGRYALILMRLLTYMACYAIDSYFSVLGSTAKFRIM